MLCKLQLQRAKMRAPRTWDLMHTNNSCHRINKKLSMHQWLLTNNKLENKRHRLEQVQDQHRPLAARVAQPLLRGGREALDAAGGSPAFREAAALGSVHVGLTGGEPAARRDLREIVAAAAAAGLYTHLVTAGTALGDAELAGLCEAGLRSVRQVQADTWPEVRSFCEQEAPLIIKPIEPYGSGGAKLCKTVEEAEAHFNLLVNGQRKLGVQGAG